MEYQNRLYLPAPGALPAANLPDVLCLPGKLAVAMHPPREMFGGLALPDVVQGRLRPDCGTVAGIGGPIMTQKGLYGPSSHLKRGDVVLVRPYQGLWDDDTFEGLQMRFYGGAASNGVFQKVAWWDDVVAVWDGMQWMPTGDNLLVRRKRDERPLVQQETWLSEGETFAVGPYGDQEIVGHRVAWSEERWDDVLIFDGEGYSGQTVIVPGYLACVAKCDYA